MGYYATAQQQLNKQFDQVEWDRVFMHQSWCKTSRFDIVLGILVLGLLAVSSG
jgi:hypothetical protein